jgi:hypothetical protein
MRSRTPQIKSRMDHDGRTEMAFTHAGLKNEHCLAGHKHG